MKQEQDNALEKRETAMTEGVEQTRPRRSFVPAASIYETDNEVVVMADLPDVAAGDVDISLENNLLTIHGTAQAKPPEGFSLAYGEYEMGDWHREFSLSNKIDADHIAAHMSHGVLTLTLPKLTPSHKRIEVQAGVGA